MANFFKIISVFAAIALVILASQFNVTNAVIHAIGIVSTTATMIMINYAIATSLIERWSDYVKNKKTKSR